MDHARHDKIVANGAAGESYYCYVDFRNRICEVNWTNTAQYPGLSSFPKVDGTVHNVPLSDEVAKAFAGSDLLNYGTDGCVRCSHLEPLPIIKLAHPNKLARLRIQHEFHMLKEMRRHSLPIPIFDDNPIIDNDGIFGYRMEQLFPIDFSNTQAVSDDLKTIVNQIHDSGFSHGDLNPSNVMRNSTGSLVLIDPSRGGPLGQEVPHFIPSYQYEGTVFSTTTDEEYLKRYFSAVL
ncbi:hypothetical protein D0861_07813 [Hortaea werneckii]|uniref:non-specific serine/threonine protein kinase n=1 Tax=Hortaea werneckii TaxID=91943 RepID=A0A3M7F1C7_HORWE|nr:hypothetical protein D0861_07813 [Hortaea werneckii]